MYEVRTTQEFDDWLDNLRNRTAVLRIAARIDRIEQGNFGDEISELRFFFGSGYRIYYILKEKIVVLLLNGGDKSSQKKDIKKANVGRDSLYKSLSETGKPRLDTIHNVLQALGLKLSIKIPC